jgi:hypothetical protein
MNPYCVILRPKPLVNSTSCQPMQNFYLSAPTADAAMKTVSDENPDFRVVAVEPGNLFAHTHAKLPSRRVQAINVLLKRTAR